MQGTSDEFQDVTRAPHHNRSRIDIIRDDVFIMSVAATSGAVTMDSTAKYRRRFDATVIDDDGTKTPGEMRDLFAPFGTEARCYSGCEIVSTTDVVDVDMSQIAWAQGTHNNTIADASGDLVLD